MNPETSELDDKLVKCGFVLTRRQVAGLQLLALRTAAREGRPMSVSRCLRRVLDDALAREEERRRGA